MTTIASTGSLASGTSKLSQPALGANDFLRLMTEQLKQQDPLNPQDNSQMVTQMAQMSATSATTEMNTTLKSMSQQIASQTALLQTIAAQTAPKTTTP